MPPLRGPLDRVLGTLGLSQQRFADLIHANAGPAGALDLDQYVRYLSMQYHIANDVQRHFFVAAAHRDLSPRRALRQFLVTFANEEELRYLIAARDLLELGETPLPAPLDVDLFHAYFDANVASRPFLRIGAACILENVTAGAARPILRLALTAPFLHAGNSRFLTAHQQETVSRGARLLDALCAADLEPHQIADLDEGARVGTVFHLRLAEWALCSRAGSRLADRTPRRLNDHDSGRMATPQIAELEASIARATSAAKGASA